MWRKSLLLLLLELGSYCLSRLRDRQSLRPSSDSNAVPTLPKVELPMSHPRETASEFEPLDGLKRRVEKEVRSLD